eukprot:CAMPEP_0175073958 /NCGR_PEP_ID=MMETSP0052_2-20121109/20943_1 /TAXON_ID=51329 ORGANISM="Polytomella parva, Strain SAG 63-3" /NCGR_SAMPLE_ID=MMETSP0052_2 /ASSEMBLY_ACC=CAM_ASM_000194 /LENGTH=47 /DNA_ID= /DNA_START= /DNA_END= /DNA_ORIENTATION=
MASSDDDDEFDVEEGKDYHFGGGLRAVRRDVAKKKKRKILMKRQLEG